MKITEIAFVTYVVSDLKKARAFYEGVLGLKPSSEYAGSGEVGGVEYDIAAGTLGLFCSPGILEPSTKGTFAALEVDDFDNALAEIKAKNVPIVRGPLEFPPCHMVIIADPDGNRITLHKRKAS